MGVKGVKVHPESPREQNWILRNNKFILISSCWVSVALIRETIYSTGWYSNMYLWYDGDSRPEVVQTKHSNVDIVNEDRASSRLNDPEQSQGE